jgi:hypothetical protein
LVNRSLSGLVINACTVVATQLSGGTNAIFCSPKKLDGRAPLGVAHGLGRIGPPIGMMKPSPRGGSTLCPRASNNSFVTPPRVGALLGVGSLAGSSGFFGFWLMVSSLAHRAA